jgi:ribosome-interacting GTPase 1
MKNSTIDIDFTGPSTHIDMFMKVQRTIPHGIHIDLYYDGRVYISQLPTDYLERSIVITENIKNILLRALQPLDIIVTKIARLNNRDREDIKTCMDRCNISNQDIQIRAEQVLESYPANEEVYKTHLSEVLGYNRRNMH